MTSPTLGIIFNPDDTDPRPAQPSDLSVVGLVLPAADADADFLPLNEPVAFDIAIKAIGGSNPQAVVAFAAQIARLQSEAQAAFGQPAQA